jgi:hypothetical protein
MIPIKGIDKHGLDLDDTGRRVDSKDILRALKFSFQASGEDLAAEVEQGNIEWAADRWRILCYRHETMALFHHQSGGKKEAGKNQGVGREEQEAPWKKLQLRPKKYSLIQRVSHLVMPLHSRSTSSSSSTSAPRPSRTTTLAFKLEKEQMGKDSWETDVGKGGQKGTVRKEEELEKNSCSPWVAVDVFLLSRIVKSIQLKSKGHFQFLSDVAHVTMCP